MSEDRTNERRRFLRAGAATAGALVLGSRAHAETAPTASTTTTSVTTTSVETVAVAPTEISLTLKKNAALTKVGGSVIVENGQDKLIVARTTANDFAACSAICTHKGCVVEYEHAAKQFVCPCHGARFGLDGKVLQGPAKKPLRSYPTDTAAVVSLATAPLATEKKS